MLLGAGHFPAFAEADDNDIPDAPALFFFFHFILLFLLPATHARLSAMRLSPTAIRKHRSRHGRERTTTICLPIPACSATCRGLRRTVRKPPSYLIIASFCLAFLLSFSCCARTRATFEIRSCMEIMRMTFSNPIAHLPPVFPNAFRSRSLSLSPPFPVCLDGQT